MGQKVNPIGLRLGINRTWDSRWFSRKEYGNQLLDDLKLRKFLGARLTQAAISRVLIERAAKKTRITLHSARPGVVIGKNGADIARMEWYREGRVPLHTLRADVDYGQATAKTTYGTCGVKVWVFKGEILAHDPMAQDKRLAEAQPAGHERGHDRGRRDRD